MESLIPTGVELPRQRAGRKFRLAAGVIALSLITACDAQADQPTAAPSPSAPTVTSPAATGATAPTNSGNPTVDPPLVTAASDKVLAPQVNGTGPGRTTPFKNRGGIFTVRVACSGGGTAKLSVDGDSYDVTCNGATQRVHVATDTKQATARIAATKTQRWTMTVVVTDDGHIRHLETHHTTGLTDEPPPFAHQSVHHSQRTPACNTARSPAVRLSIPPEVEAVRWALSGDVSLPFGGLMQVSAPSAGAASGSAVS